MGKFKTTFGGKKQFKRYSKQCQICGEKEYKLLDVHRIIEGGDYSYDNCVCLCTSCHRKNHTKIISIIKIDSLGT